MKINEPVTQKELPLGNDDTLISTTSLKGVITSVNDEFLEVSGFDLDELIGRSHNVIRHPDMPQEAFSDLWETIKLKKPWMGLVKNRRKNGDHYFVDAYVTPVYDGDEITGYQSVRFKPDQHVVDRATKIYKDLREKKKDFLGVFRLTNIKYRTKLTVAALLITIPAIVVAAQTSSLQAFALPVSTFAVALLCLWALLAPFIKLSEDSRDFFDNPMARQVYTGRKDEVGQLELAMKALRAQNRTILGRVEYSAEVLGQVADQTNSIVALTTDGVSRQQAEVDQMATAMNEMAATVAEVARLADSTAVSSSGVLAKTTVGGDLVDNAVEDIGELSTTVADATAVIERLKNDSQNIGSVVDVISNIASETNLLALNAAIEAARAGEQGRGFAVVADEVRNLASNTQQSTDEIQQMIKTIQQSSAEAVDAMNKGRQRADQSVERAASVGEAFAEISEEVEAISAMNAQVATASEQQSVVADEVNRNVVAINEVANETLVSATNTAEESQKLTALVGRLRSMVKQFGHL